MMPSFALPNSSHEPAEPEDAWFSLTERRTPVQFDEKKAGFLEKAGFYERPIVK